MSIKMQERMSEIWVKIEEIDNFLKENVKCLEQNKRDTMKKIVRIK